MYKHQRGGHTTTIIGTPSFDGTKDKIILNPPL